MALTPPEKTKMKTVIDTFAGYDLSTLKKQSIYFNGLLSALGGNLQTQTAQLLYPEDFLIRYGTAFPIMPPDEWFYSTDQSFYNQYGEIDTAAMTDYVDDVYWTYWRERMTFAFTKTKTLYQPLFENFAKIFSDFAAAEETTSDDYTRTDYPAPYGTVETAYATGATRNTGTTKRVGKGSENPDRLIKIKEFANITEQYLKEFDWLFVWGGTV